MDLFIKALLAVLVVGTFVTPIWYFSNKKVAALLGACLVLLELWGLSQIHGGARALAKGQMECIGEGESVQMDSSFSYIWNTCAINRGTEESPRWVISKRDVGAGDVEADL